MRTSYENNCLIREDDHRYYVRVDEPVQKGLYVYFPIPKKIKSNMRYTNKYVVVEGYCSNGERFEKEVRDNTKYHCRDKEGKYWYRMKIPKDPTEQKKLC